MPLDTSRIDEIYPDAFVIMRLVTFTITITVIMTTTDANTNITITSSGIFLSKRLATCWDFEVSHLLCKCSKKSKDVLKF